VWTTQTFTTLERPPNLAGKEFFTEEEAAALNKELTAEGVNPSARSALSISDPVERAKLYEQARGDNSYDAHHYDNLVWHRGVVPKGLSTRRTSLIKDPPDGRLPPLTAEAKRRIADTAKACAPCDATQQHPRAFDSYENRPLQERCIVWSHEGPPLMPPPYNDIYQIFQTPDSFVVVSEMSTNPVHIVPLDGRPHLSEKLRLYNGDSRGRWEGDTLVVETTNYAEERRLQKSTKAVRIVERFTRVSTDQIHYEFTVDDPNTWTRPWTVELPMAKLDARLYEYACHEGNYGLPNMLTVYRNLERKAAAAASQHDGK
jgi:hypothetical protein